MSSLESLQQYKQCLDGNYHKLSQRMILPDDNRFKIAFMSLNIGTADGAVLALGAPGSGKTEFGNQVVGAKYFETIEATDTEESLFGYPNPLDSNKWNTGKIKVNGADPRFFLNEVNQVRNTGPMHRLFDGRRVTVNNVTFDEFDMVVYATANFPDGNRANVLDEAVRSRFSMEVLTGDDIRHIAPQLQQGGRARQARWHDRNLTDSGLILPTKNRNDLNYLFDQHFTYSNKTGEYVVQLIDRLQETGLVSMPAISDTRIGAQFTQAALAYKLAYGNFEQCEIDTVVYAAVASLVLPSIVQINQEGIESLETSKKNQNIRSKYVTHMERAIAVRHIIAELAFESALDITGTMRGADSADNRRKFRETHAYANPGNQLLVVEDFIARAK